MTAQKWLHLPSIPSEQAILRSQKVALMGDVIKWLERKNVGWSSDRVTLGTKFVSAVTDILWYIDGHHDTLQYRACSVPVEFREFQGYNKPEVAKHRRRSLENMCSGMLNNYSLQLNEYLMQPWFSSAIWKPVKGCVTQLAESLHKYSIYLNEKNATVNENHAMLQPVRSASEAESFHLISRARWVKTNVATMPYNGILTLLMILYLFCLMILLQQMQGTETIS